MGSSSLESQRQHVIEALESVSHSTERVYQTMGDAFPSLVRELDANFGPSDTSTRDPLSETVEATLTAISDHEGRFARGHEDSGRMLTKLEEQLSALGSLGRCIDDIREDSVLMELISLNAMVIAVKAGESGRAFSCITAELKQLSNQTMGLTDQIAAGEDSLDRVFSEFKADLRTMTAREKKMFADFLAQIREVFEGLSSGSARLWEGLEAIRRRSDQVKVPLVRIMVDIQNQDRIRQGIDHVLLSLREVRASAPTNVPDQLDELSFLIVLPELSSQVLEEISGQIAANHDAFRRSLADAKELIGALEEERSHFLTHNLESRRSGSLEDWFQKGEDVFAAFMSQAESVSRNRETAFRRSSSLQKNVGELMESLRSFDFLLSKFRNIDVASRIQVARQAALASMKDNATEMSGLTRKIEQDVGASMNITSEFFTTVEALFHSYRGQLNRQSKEEDSFHSRLRETMKNLRGSKEYLHRSVQETRVFTRTFTDLFAKTEADLGLLQELVRDMAAQRQNLEGIRRLLLEQKERIMAENGIAEWKLESAKLKSMVDRFTIFTHKKLAAELGDFEVEQSVESGEVTLF